MNIIDQRILGILIVLLLAILVAVKRVASGTILEKPHGGLLLWLVNIFNLFFLLIANPVAAVLLIAGQLRGADPTAIEFGAGWLVIAVEGAGLLIYVSGFLLMGWALIRLGGNYQLGGSDPRPSDVMILTGPYTLVRHPMYTAALCIAFGLTCLTGSLACFAAFVLYLVLIVLLIPFEEVSLLRSYGKNYEIYQQKVKKLVPLLY